MIVCRKVTATSEREVSKIPQFSEESNKPVGRGL
jgi:hypothetical protein